jgi:hypothetical protein
MVFCSRYPGLSEGDRMHFWAGLISAMVKRESSFNPKATFTESFREHGADSPIVISRGLLQLSFPEDRDKYHCKLQRADDLYDAQTNITCGVTVLSTLVSRDGRIAGREGSRWKGGAAYWSVLRSAGGKDNSNSKSLNSIKKFTQSMAVCRAP